MTEAALLPILTGTLDVVHGPALARHLRASGLSCWNAAGPGDMPDWGLITLSDPADLMRACVLLEGHPQVTGLAESRDRINGLWPLFYRVARSGLPHLGLPTAGTPEREAAPHTD